MTKLEIVFETVKLVVVVALAIFFFVMVVGCANPDALSNAAYEQRIIDREADELDREDRIRKAKAYAASCSAHGGTLLIERSAHYHRQDLRNLDIHTRDLRCVRLSSQ